MKVYPESKLMISKLLKMVLVASTANFFSGQLISVIFARYPTTLLLWKTREKSNLVYYKFCNIRIDNVVDSDISEFIIKFKKNYYLIVIYLAARSVSGLNVFD